MYTRMIPFGKAGWDERKDLLRSLIASRRQPPFLYNDVLLLVPSARLKRRYGRLLLDALHAVHGVRCLAQPEIQTLHQFIQQLYARLHGRQLMDEQCRLVLLEGLVKERLSGSTLFNQRPDLLAPSLSSVLAKTVEQLAVSGITPQLLSHHIGAAEFSDKPQVRLLQDVYAGYQQVLNAKNLTDPAGMRHILRDRFDPALLAPYRRVIIDGIHDIEQVEADILKRIAGCTDCTLIVDAASPELVSRAGRSHPLRMVKEFLECVSPVEIEEQTASADADTALAEALFSDEPFAETAARIRSRNRDSEAISLLTAINTREEVALIARQVKKSLEHGTLAETILVAFPALDEYAPLVEELFADYGIPYNRALGRQLGTSAVATAVITLLRAAQDDFSAPSLLRVFSSPFLRFADHQELTAAIDRFLRERNMTGGKQRLLAAVKHEAPDSVPAAPIRELIDALEPFGLDESAGLSVWMERLSQLLLGLRLRERVALIKGPLNTNQQALKKLDETFLSLSAAGRTFPEYQYTFSEWLFLLRKTFMHVRFQVPPEDESGVQLLGLEESIALPWTEIYLGGMIDAKFPQRLPQNIFLPEQTLETMGVRTLERARLKASYHFYRILLSAPKVTLSHPEQDGDKPIVPSPFLQELAPLELSGVLNRNVKKKSGLQFNLKINDSRSLNELAKAIAIAAPEKKRELSRQLTALPAPRPDDAGRIQALLDTEQRSGTPAALPCPAMQVFRVTDLDAYLACPYDYYISRVLGIEPLEEVSDDISPRDRGSKVHAVLRDFYRSWRKPITRENRKEALALLFQLTGAIFASDADTFRNRRTRDLFQKVMAERFVDAEMGFWTQGLTPCFLEQSIEHFSLDLSNGVRVHLSGKIDRIDRDESGRFVVVDYKTGKYPLPKQNSDQDIFQLPVYAMMAKETLSRPEERLVQPIGLAYYDLAGKIAKDARDVVLFDSDARSDHPCSKPKASPKSAEEFQSILHQSLDKARMAVEGILAGKFPALPRSEDKCRFCASQVICRREEGE